MQVTKTIEKLLADYFNRLAQGYDISPAERFRIEGYFKACLELGVIDAAWLNGIKQHYRSDLAASKLQLPAWRLCYQMKAAPVTAPSG